MLRSQWQLLGSFVLAIGLFGVAGAVRADDKKDAAVLNAAWTDLASADEVKAARALLAMTANPKETTAFLARRLKAVKVNKDAVAKLVQNLDSDDLNTRNAASQELEYLGKYAKAELEKHKGTTPSAEARKRIGDLLEKLPDDENRPAAPPQLKGNRVGVQNNNGNITIIIDGKPLDLTTLAPPPPAPNLKWVRAARAAVVLEHLGTPEARQVLEKLASGEAEAPPTKAARDSLERLKAKAK
jgi:hypothetical protein